MAKREQRDWIVCTDATYPDWPCAFRCLRCGIIQPVALPIDVNTYIRFARAFAAEHGRCLGPKSEIRNPKSEIADS